MSEDPLENLREALAERPEVELAILFGSAARGALHAGSDVDLAVRLRAAPGPWELGGLSMDLGSVSGRRVDLVILDEVRSALLRHEIAAGRLLKGNEEDFVQFRRVAFREWREFAPRFRRCTDAMLSTTLSRPEETDR